jgi:photosystem II cytochrome c550|nr:MULTISPECIES: photosystem II cytochrome c-550 [Spirulina]
MMRPVRLILVAIATLVFGWQFAVNPASAINVDQKYREIVINPAGETAVISNEDLEHGKRLFNDTCSQCHMAGRTKTNPNVTLRLEDLEGAEPPRDNVAAIVDFTNSPMTYDGEIDLSDLHPSTKRADLWPEMRGYTQDDLRDIAGYILVQPKLQGYMWGGGKTVN